MNEPQNKPLHANAAAKIHQQDADRFHKGITDGLKSIYAQISTIISALESKGNIDIQTEKIISNAKLLAQASNTQNHHKLTASEISHEITTAATCLASVFVLTRINTQTETKVKTKTIKTTRSEQGKNLVDVRHDQPGGSRDVKKQIKTAWMSGQYRDKTKCARELAKFHHLEVESIRNQLKKYPNPDPWPAKTNQHK